MKTPPIYSASQFSLGGTWSFVWGAKPTKAHRGDGTASLPLLPCPWICMLCEQTSPKRWFANVNMTS